MIEALFSFGVPGILVLICGTLGVIRCLLESRVKGSNQAGESRALLLNILLKYKKHLLSCSVTGIYML